MMFVKPGPMPNPAAAEDITTSLWATSQFHLCRLSLWTLGLGDNELRIGVSSQSPTAERQAVRTISLGTPLGMEEVEPADAVIASALAASECFCISVVPQHRQITLGDQTWWRQNNDPLYPLHTMIERTPKNNIAGSVFTFRALANGASRASLTVFAVGPGARALAEGIVAQYQAIGSKSRVPLCQQRALERTLSGQMRRPDFTVTQGAIEVYWHPPFLHDPRRKEVSMVVV